MHSKSNGFYFDLDYTGKRCDLSLYVLNKQMIFLLYISLNNTQSWSTVQSRFTRVVFFKPGARLKRIYKGDSPSTEIHRPVVG